MALTRNAIYPLSVFLWAVYLVLYPPWIGCKYEQSSPGADSLLYLLEGTFELDQNLGEVNRAPLWNAPSRLRASMHGTLRWPWQPVSQSNHIELNTGKLVWHFSVGILALGIMMGIWHWFSIKYERNEVVSVHRANRHMLLIYMIVWLAVLFLAVPVLFQPYTKYIDIWLIVFLFIACMSIGVPLATVTIAWSISMALIVTLLGFLLLVVLSRGYLAMALTGNQMVIVLVAAMLSGGVAGWFLQRRRGNKVAVNTTK